MHQREKAEKIHQQSRCGCQVNQKLNRHVTMEMRNKVLYLQLAKALYSCMQSALLWYETIKGCLEHLGFVLNPCNPCVANQTIKDKQCTICWFVDDTKISHEDPTVVSWAIYKLECHFGKMMITHSKRHTFVGMDIEFKQNGIVELSMDNYIDECIQIYSSQPLKKYKMPAVGTLFDHDIEEKQVTLTESDAEHIQIWTTDIISSWCIYELKKRGKCQVCPHEVCAGSDFYWPSQLDHKFRLSSDIFIHRNGDNDDFIQSSA